MATPAWQLYLDHARQGVSLRALARREGVHPSTMLRLVRRVEDLRDDPLVDAALRRLEDPLPLPLQKDPPPMSIHPRPAPAPAAQISATGESLRLLRRLAEPGARLAVATGLEKAAVLRSFPDGRQLRTAVVATTLAQGFVLKDWISCRTTGRVALYELTLAGRSALRRALNEEEADAGPGLAEAASSFAAQHRDWGSRVLPAGEGAAPRRIRVNVNESPVGLLGRRRDKDGQPYLSPEQILAAERLREDFELAQMGPRVTQNWDRFLTGGGRGDFSAGDAPLGPGLGDMVLRCCCYLEGVEAAEKRLGWAARSGKVVLRIALDRLRRHYEEAYGGKDRLIG